MFFRRKKTSRKKGINFERESRYFQNFKIDLQEPGLVPNDRTHHLWLFPPKFKIISLSREPHFLHIILNKNKAEGKSGTGRINNASGFRLFFFFKFFRFI